MFWQNFWGYLIKMGVGANHIRSIINTPQKANYFHETTCQSHHALGG